jgi:hypothetical protein
MRMIDYWMLVIGCIIAIVGIIVVAIMELRP